MPKFSQITAKKVKHVRVLVGPAGEVSVLSNGHRPTKGEDVIKIAYSPARITPAAQKEMEAVSTLPEEERDEASIRLMALTVNQLIVSWDVHDDQDKPIPITAKNLMEMEGFLPLVSEVCGALFEAEAPSGKVSEPSKRPSSRRVQEPKG